MNTKLVRAVVFSLFLGLLGGCPVASDQPGPTIVSDARDVDPSSIRKRDTDRSGITKRDVDRASIRKRLENKSSIDRELSISKPREPTPAELERFEYEQTQREEQEERKRRQGWYRDDRRSTESAGR
jgi:hypothetical protein